MSDCCYTQGIVSMTLVRCVYHLYITCILNGNPILPPNPLPTMQLDQSFTSVSMIPLKERNKQFVCQLQS